MGDYNDYARGHRTARRPHAASSDRKLQLELARGREYRSPETPHTRAAPEGHSSGAAGGWSLSASDAEAKRRRRVAGYKAYAVEGKVKASVRQGFRWIKGKCIGLVHFW